MKYFSFILLSFFLFGFYSCNKFEDGNNFSIRTVKGRLIKGSPWIFEKLTVDGVDKSEEFRSDSSYFNEIRFNKVHRLTTDEFSLATVSDFCYSSGDFELIEKNKIKIFLLENGCAYGEFDYYAYGPIFRAIWIEWEITRLSMKELQMKTIYNGIEYKLFLKSSDQ